MLNKKVLIEQVRPDPKQPRKIFNEEYVRGLSESLKVEGMIKQLEMEENRMDVSKFDCVLLLI